jgi:hypothetical protein
MPVQDHIDNAARVANFNPIAPTTNFALPFPVYEADDATELKNDFLVTLAGVAVTNYTVTGTFLDGVSLDAQIVFSPGITGALIIYSRRKPRSGEDVASGRGITGTELNALFNGVTASIRDVYDWLARLESGIGVPPGTFLQTSGGTMTGPIVLPADPTLALQAATKQYADAKAPLTTKGDLLTHTGAAAVRQGIGTNGKRLIADSTLANGMRWDFDSFTKQTLVDAATIAWDMSLADSAVVTLGGNRAFGPPTNVVVGRRGLLYVIEDGTGGRVPTWDAIFVWPGGVVQRPQQDFNSVTCYEWLVTTNPVNPFPTEIQSASGGSRGAKRPSSTRNTISVPMPRAAPSPRHIAWASGRSGHASFWNARPHKLPMRLATAWRPTISRTRAARLARSASMSPTS